MASQNASIQRLPLESQAQIGSSVIITSLNDVIIGLLENVLDAGTTSAEVHLDYVKGYCSVTDNGIGIPAAEFGPEGHLGSLHCTSKLNVSGPTYGRYGRFVYHLGALSLLSITSKHDASASAITFHRANIIARSDGEVEHAASIRGEHGTHVVVTNLFGDVPVRYRHIAARLEGCSAAEAEFSMLKKRIAALILACGRAVDMKVVEVRTKRSYRQRSNSLKRRTSFDLDAICAVLQQAGYIDSSQASSFKLVSVQTSSIRIRAAISLQPAPAKDVQLISIGIRPIHVSTFPSLFSDEINAAFELSSFGALEDDVNLPEAEQERREKDCRFASDRHTNRHLNGQKKGVDRWPMFYVRIDPRDTQASGALGNGQGEAGLTEKWVEKVLSLLRSMFFEFLSVHHFRPRSKNRRRLEKVSLDRVPIAELAPSPAGNVENPLRTLPVRSTPNSSIIPNHFDAWSRVKTGTTSAQLMKIPSNIYELAHLGANEHATSRSQTSSERIELAQNALGDIELQSLDDGDIELLLEDYHEEAYSDVGTRSPRGAENLNENSDGGPANAPNEDEAAYLWTNPGTGIEYKINALNGLILPQSKTTTAGPYMSYEDGSERSSLASVDTTIALRIRAKPAKKSPAELIASLQQSDLVRSFCPVEERIKSIVPHDHDDTATAQQRHDCGDRRRKTSEYFSVPAQVQAHNLSKADLESADVLAQVDQKFMLVQTQAAEVSQPLLVLIDQHAADERVKVEELYTQLCSGESTILSKPIIFEVPHRELELFQRHKARFAEWQIRYEVKEKSSARDTSAQITVRALPSLISERCRLDPRLLIDLLRREIHNLSPASSSTPSSSDWIHRIPHCPQGLIEMINSRACRSAIMFNDVLDKEQCEELLKKLVRSTLPFQCAHARPSCVVLPGWAGNNMMKDAMGFADKFREWRD